MIYLQLFLEFFHIGLFSFGGGYATIPFLYHIAETHEWYTAQQLTDMIAVSSITPGPVGVNVATFAGYTTSGILGSVIATASVVLPSLIIVIIVSKLLEQFKHNEYVKSIIYCLKPAGCGLLAAVGVNMFISGFNLIGLVLFLILFAMSLKKKHDPLVYLGISAAAGLIIYLINPNM